MTLSIFNDLEQGSEEWLAVRRGMVTASVVGQLISQRTLTAIDYWCPECSANVAEPCTSKRGGGPIKTMHPGRTAYAQSNRTTVVEPATEAEMKPLAAIIAAERINGWTEETHMTFAMWRGVEDEPLARDYYSQHVAPVQQVGFMVDRVRGIPFGFSPDGLVGDDGLIEIKSRAPKAHLLTIHADEVPAANVAQLQAGLLVSGREWVDYVSWCGGMNPYIKRATPDAAWFAAIVSALERFEDVVEAITADYYNRVGGLPATERIIRDEVVV